MIDPSSYHANDPFQFPAWGLFGIVPSNDPHRS